MENILHVLKNILIIDCGNTLTKFCLFDNQKIIKSSTLETKGITKKILDTFFDFTFNDGIIGSVVPEVSKVICAFVEEKFAISLYHITSSTKSQLRFSLPKGEELGDDLLAAAEAVVSEEKIPSLIIDMGTAITLTTIDQTKSLLGCVIYPGIKTGFDNLFKTTSLLKKTSLVKPNHLFGTNTFEAINSGAFFGTKFMLEGFINAFISDHPLGHVIFTGGDSLAFAQQFSKATFDEELVIKGLISLYKLNRC